MAEAWREQRLVRGSADPLGELDDRLDQLLPLKQREVVVVGARDLHDTRSNENAGGGRALVVCRAVPPQSPRVPSAGPGPAAVRRKRCVSAAAVCRGNGVFSLGAQHRGRCAPPRSGCGNAQESRWAGLRPLSILTAPP